MGQSISRKRFYPAMALMGIAIAVMAMRGQDTPLAAHNDEFIQRNGTELTLHCEKYRYSGANTTQTAKPAAHLRNADQADCDV